LEQNGTATASGIRVGELVTTNNSTIDNYHVAQIVKGNSDVEAEKTTALDIGYRYIESDWNLDINGFATESKNALALQTDLDPYSIDEILALGNPLAIYAALQNSTVINNFVSNAELTTYGGEVLFKKSLTEKITAEIGYNYTSFEYDLQPDTTQAIGNNSDLNQFFFKASAKVTQDHYVMMLYRYEEGSAYQTDDFGALDLSWNWLIDDTFAFTLTGNNLIAGEYQEYDNTGELFTVPTYIESSVVARLSANF
jgi:iron complex outermembrane receptor protein